MADVDMSETGEEFHLSSIIVALKNDIKGISVTSSNEIVVAGREEKIKFFARRRGEYTMYKEIPQPAGLVVNSLAIYEEGGDWLLFAGRKDGSIVVYSNQGQVNSLDHHKMNVSCLHVDKTNKKLYSGSWDNSVIVWPIAQVAEPNISALLLTGHTLSVWALEAFENRPGLSLSASADKTIKLWKDDNCVRTYKGHTDVVRCLQIVSNDTFISAANDFTYRVWHIDSPDALAVFPSHMEDFIFSISLVGDHLVSCGDTGFIEIWKMEKSDSGENLKHKQVIKSPASTQWISRAISDNEFVIGGSDGRVYAYSTDPEKKAPADVMNMVSDLLSEKMTAEIMRKDHEKKEEIVIKVALDEGAANLELRYQKGADPAIAAENFIQANNLPISYLNEITDYIVANIPEARQAQNRKFKKQPTQKIMIDGAAYDFAMDVTVDNKTMKMPFNMGEEPDMVAFRFCEKQEIPIKYAPKLAELVRKDLQGISSRSAADFYDPFTGSGRYVPGQTASSGGGADPLTGSGRYIPAASTRATSSGIGDPFTSGGRYIPGSADTNIIPNASRPADKLRPRCEFVPMTNFYSFGVEGAANQKAIAKLKKANEQQTGTKMNPDQLAAMEQLLGAQPGSIQVGEVEKASLELGLMWPFEHIQMIIDLLRCALLHRDLNEYFCSPDDKGPATRARIFEILVSNPPTVVKVFICRAISNAFAHQAGRDMMAADAPDFSQLIPQVVACFNVSSAETGSRQLQLAAASALANWSLLLLQRSQKITELGPREDVLRAIIAGLEPVLSYSSHDETALIRILQAVVTLMWGDKQVIQTAKNRNIVSIVNKLKDSITDEAGKNVARCVVEMVYV